ncbi:MAG: TM0106 family RecB-like putative nuclease, partial [Actinomycetota bacterium]
MKKISQDLWSFNTRDLMRSAGCPHCLTLAIAREKQVPGVLETIEPFIAAPEGLAITYGELYEQALENELREQLGADFQKPEGDALSGTKDLMHQGIPVIYQGSLRQKYGRIEFSGRPDFLVRGDYQLEFRSGKLTAQKLPAGDQKRYIAWDAKLSSSAKPNYLLQIALYTDALIELDLQAEGEPGLILGSRELARFEQSEILPAMRAARAELAAAIENFDETTSLAQLTLFCETKDLCKICEYPALCEVSREKVDHLVQVAGINRSQIEKLQKSGIGTMAQLAKASESDRPAELLPHSFERLRIQAKLQIDYKQTGQVSYLLLPDPEIKVLPPESEGDIFFDMEGFPYFPEKGGLEYLFGNTLRDGSFKAFFAHDRKEEKAAFENFMEFVLERLAQFPDAHVYHYAAYELTALSRLAARHGVKEQEVTELISSGKMIDLYKVVRGSIMVSQPSYSIKKLEAFYSFDRKSKVLDAGSSIEEYDRYR